MFYVGAQEGAWLGRARLPVMLSRARIERRRAPLPRATVPWFLDSAAFTELETHGRWTVTGAAWAAMARRWADEAGNLRAVASQDWLCTPGALERSGLTVADHQRRTVESYLELLELEPTLPWVPTLQGWAPGDYLDHLDQYAGDRFDLEQLPVVGIGSIAGRQSSPAAAQAVTAVRRAGLANLHAFGAKVLGLATFGWAVASADSMAWSATARREATRLDGCRHAGDCRNCQRWAETWAAGVAHLVGAGQPQLELDLEAG